VLEKYDDILDNNTKVIIYNNVGNIYYNNKKPEEAQAFFIQAHQLAQSCNYREMVAHAMAQLGRTKTALKEYDEALQIAQEAQTIIAQLDTPIGKQINLINLGDIYYQKQQPQRAIGLLQEGLEIAIQLKDHVNELRAYQLLALLYQQLQDYKQAFFYQFKYSTRKEEFTEIEDSRRFLDFEIQHSIKEKQKEIEQLTKENEYQALLLNKSDQINQQNEELIAMNEELRQFAYVASHDLKEPLRMIGSYTQLIQRLYRSKLDEESGTYFNFISEGVERMNNLLDALLQYATIGRSDEEERAIDLNDVVEICKVHLRVLLAETDAVIYVHKLPTVVSTQSLLIQLVQNLLSNAIKFRRPDVRPEVHIRAKETPEQYIISVEDNGIGIDKEYLERIFVIFQRLHARTKYKGTGIGLSICQKIAKRLGGAISVSSKVGEGSTFSFTIPKK
ncbi:MAG: ATP-binding protein, partial [Bacteroidota bacterium]